MVGLRRAKSRGSTFLKGGFAEGLPAAPDIEFEPESQIVELRVLSSHACGRVFRWHVIANKDFTVEDLLRTIVRRSQATIAPLDEGAVTLVELLHGRLYRTFEPESRLDRLRKDDVLVVYEVPMFSGDGFRDAQTLTVACHARFVRNPADRFFGEDGDEALREITGMPILFRVREGISEACLYDLVRAGFYRNPMEGASTARSFGGQERPPGRPPSSFDSIPVAGQAVVPFELYHCEVSRCLSTGGSRLDPSFQGPAELYVAQERNAVLLAAEWLPNQELAPWVLQQMNLCGPLSQDPESYMEIILGVDLMELCRHMQLLRTSRHELIQEVADLRSCAGRMAGQSSRDAEVRNAEAMGTSSPSTLRDKQEERMQQLQKILRGESHCSQRPPSPSQYSQSTTSPQSPQSQLSHSQLSHSPRLPKLQQDGLGVKSSPNRRKAPLASPTTSGGKLAGGKDGLEHDAVGEDRPRPLSSLGLLNHRSLMPPAA